MLVLYFLQSVIVCLTDAVTAYALKCKFDCFDQNGFLYAAVTCSQMDQAALLSYVCASEVMASNLFARHNARA